MHATTLFLTTTLAALSSAKNIDIAVGKEGLSFWPNSTTADKGDTLTFHFYPKAHNVVQGSFDSACTPMKGGGIYSDFVPVEDGVGNKTFVVEVNSTEPMWYYCSQGSHCQGGMVGVVNPPDESSGKTLAAYAKSAAKADENKTPDWPVSGGKLVEASSSSSESSGESGSSDAWASGSEAAAQASGTPGASSGAVEGARAWGVGALVGAVAVGVAGLL